MDLYSTIFWIFIGCYSFIILIKLIILRFYRTPTRIIIRDGGGIEHVYNNFPPNNRHIIILTNRDNEIVVANDIEVQQPLIEECPICHDILEINVIKTECNHVYHKSCLISWINTGQIQSLKCPLCLQSLETI